ASYRQIAKGLFAPLATDVALQERIDLMIKVWDIASFLSLSSIAHNLYFTAFPHRFGLAARFRGRN
ncbi:MAG: hypothetical protein KDB79_15295, partial [Acidobacteria bacterium]|nr:hypothetical protein [Acidobacteriota bacterium]